MRILFLTNFYPPYERGGYEELCFETVTRLKRRGHEVAVLTSNYRDGNAGLPGEADTGRDWRTMESEGVYRLLSLESDLLHYHPASFFTTRRRQERENLGHLFTMIERFRPHVLFVWGMWNLSRRLPAVIERRGSPHVIYYISDPWPAEPDRHRAYWERPAGRRWMELPKRALAALVSAIQRLEGEPELRFEHALIVSAALRDEMARASLPLAHAEVVHNGIDITDFPHRSTPGPHERPDRTLRLLYAGGIGRHKGVHTSVEALGILCSRLPEWQVTLTIAGSGHPAYVAALHELADQLDVSGQVHFQGRIPRQEMPALYPSYDILVFPSVWEEPLARTPMEAMASGLVVVGTTTGGSKEILVDGENALVFVPEDARGLACQIERLAREPQLYRRLAHAGRESVLKGFTLDGMIDPIEKALERLAGRL